MNYLPPVGPRRMSPRPSVNQMLATAPTFEALAAMHAEILCGLAGEPGIERIHPSPKTLRVWAETVWARVLQLMAEQPRQAPFIYNATLRWPKPAALQAELERAMRAAVATLPPSAFATKAA